MMNEVYLEIHPVDGHRRVCGRSYIETRRTDREVARQIIHELVEEILDHLYPPQPRQASEEAIIDEIRKLEGVQCK